MTHDHAHTPDLSRSTIRRLALSLGITLLFLVFEILAGLFANSLALLTDAAHNFTDVLALALTWWAVWVITKPANSAKTYGYHRAGILVALVNSTTLALIALGIFYEGWKRFISPPTVQADILIGVGAAAVVVNLATALLVRRGSEHDLNLKSAFLHLMGDVFSTLGAVAAGILIRFTGWNWLDALVSVLIGFLILWNAWGILRESLEILMESVVRFPPSRRICLLKMSLSAWGQKSRPRWERCWSTGTASTTPRFNWSVWTVRRSGCIAISQLIIIPIKYAHSYRSYLLPSSHLRSDHLCRTFGARFRSTRPRSDRDDHPVRPLAAAR
jgi:cation diffusion facilitator family transporter